MKIHSKFTIFEKQKPAANSQSMNLLPGRIKRSWCHPASKQLLSSLWIRSFSTSYPTPITLRLRQPLLRSSPFAAAPQRPIHKGCKRRTFHHRRLALASISYATISYHRIYGIYLSTIFLFCQEYFKIFFKFYAKNENPSTAIPRTTKIKPVARFKTFASDRFAKSAAILAKTSVNKTHNKNGSASGIPPIAKWETAPVSAVKVIINTLVPTAVFNSKNMHCSHFFVKNSYAFCSTPFHNICQFFFKTSAIACAACAPPRFASSRVFPFDPTSKITLPMLICWLKRSSRSRMGRIRFGYSSIALS